MSNHIPDTRFAEKLQELVNRYGFNTLEQAAESDHFLIELFLVYTENNGEWLDALALDGFADSREDRAEKAKQILGVCLSSEISTRAVLMAYLRIPADGIIDAVFEDFSGYWDSGDDDEVIPYSRWWQNAQRDCEATGLGI